MLVTSRQSGRRAEHCVRLDLRGSVDISWIVQKSRNVAQDVKNPQMRTAYEEQVLGFDFLFVPTGSYARRKYRILLLSPSCESRIK